MFRVGAVDARKPILKWTALAAAPFFAALVLLSITGLFLHHTIIPALAGFIASAALAFATALYGVTLWGESNEPVSKDRTFLAVAYGCCAVLAGMVILLLFNISLGVATVVLPLATAPSCWVIASLPKNLQTELDAANNQI